VKCQQQQQQLTRLSTGDLPRTLYQTCFHSCTRCGLRDLPNLVHTLQAIHSSRADLLNELSSKLSTLHHDVLQSWSYSDIQAMKVSSVTTYEVGAGRTTCGRSTSIMAGRNSKFGDPKLQSAGFGGLVQARRA